MPSPYSLPSVNRQLFIAGYLNKLKGGHLHEALVETCREVDPTELRTQLSRYSPAAGLKCLVGTSIRDEDVFATPVVLYKSPKLLGYYRMLLGFSMKKFYSTSTGLSKFRRLEECGAIPPDLTSSIEGLCISLNDRAGELAAGIAADSFEESIRQLPLLTFGAQADGAWRNIIGTSATSTVYKAIRDIVTGGGTEIHEDEGSFTFRNRSNRTVRVSFSADPDVTIKELILNGSDSVYKVAIEIKGGRDPANVHNRAGEAEKSHQKAISVGALDCWTVLDLSLTATERLKVESPSTHRWIDLRSIESGHGQQWDEFVALVEASSGI